MTNKEKLKKIIDDDYDKTKNYNEIIKKINKKNNYFKYMIVSACLIIITISVAINNNYKFHNENTRDDIMIDNIDNKFIIGIFDDQKNNSNAYTASTNESSLSFDESNPKEIYQNADYILKIKVLNIKEGIFQSNSKLLTPIYVDVLEIIKGNYNKKIDIIFKYGGIISVEEALKNLNNESIEKMGLNKLTEDERKTKYIKYSENNDYDLKKDKIYLVALDQDNEGNFIIKFNGYGVFNYNNGIYTNYITGKKLILE